MINEPGHESRGQVVGKATWNRLQPRLLCAAMDCESPCILSPLCPDFAPTARHSSPDRALVALWKGKKGSYAAGCALCDLPCSARFWSPKPQVGGSIPGQGIGLQEIKLRTRLGILR